MKQSVRSKLKLTVKDAELAVTITKHWLGEIFSVPCSFQLAGGGIGTMTGINKGRHKHSNSVRGARQPRHALLRLWPKSLTINIWALCTIDNQGVATSDGNESGTLTLPVGAVAVGSFVEAVGGQTQQKWAAPGEMRAARDGEWRQSAKKKEQCGSGKWRCRITYLWETGGGGRMGIGGGSCYRLWCFIHFMGFCMGRQTCSCV